MPPSPWTGSIIIAAVLLLIASFNLAILLNSIFLNPERRGPKLLEYFLFFYADNAPNVLP